MPDDTTVFHKLCHVGDTHWAIDYGNGRVYKSKDNAANWELTYQSDGEFLEAIQFLDKDNGFLCGDYGLIMKTTDGGESWTEIGPSYVPRITKVDEMANDSSAIYKSYYQMFFKNQKEGMLWGYQVTPLRGWRETYKQAYHKTSDGGESWETLNFKTRAEGDSIVADFLGNDFIPNQTLFNKYYTSSDLVYDAGRRSVTINSTTTDTSFTYTMPQVSDERFMMRYVNFINDKQGYFFGGSLVQDSIGYILETLDGGKSWRNTGMKAPHIHYSLQKDKSFLLAGKNGYLKKWQPQIKQDSSFIHIGDAERILIDGKKEKNEWEGANKTYITQGIDMYTIQDDHYLYLCIDYDTSLYRKNYVDLFFELGQDSLLNLHSSSQLGERTLKGNEWTDRDPPTPWGYYDGWTANRVVFSREKKEYIPYKAIEFQISKSRLPKDKLKVAIQTRDLEWENEWIIWPQNDNFNDTSKWKTLHWE